jgi:parvulin-like peptidyl-prolyl isomerase
MTNIDSFAELSEADFRWVFSMQLLREKVIEALTADIPKEQDQVWARHIILSDETKAQTIYERLINGEDFNTLATEVYTGTDTLNTTDLGWFGTGVIDITAEQEVFNMQIGQISKPIQTTSGWEIYQVLGHEVRPLTDAELQQLQQTEFENWLEQQKTAAGFQIYDIWKTRVPARPTIPPTQASQ